MQAFCHTWCMPSLNPHQFTCSQCGEPLSDHVSEGKHGANALFPEIEAKFGGGNAPLDLIQGVNQAARTAKVNLGNRKELVNHLESVAGHGLIDDVGANSVEYRDSYDHIGEDVPGVDFSRGPEKLSTPELQSLHTWLHNYQGIPHLTNGNEHYHV